MSSLWLTILFIALVAKLSTQIEDTVSSSNSHQSVPQRSETAGADHHGGSNDSCWRPHFHSVHNIQVQGCCQTSTTSDFDRVLNATRTVLADMTRAILDNMTQTIADTVTQTILDNVTRTVLNILQNQESNYPPRDTPHHTPARIVSSDRPRDCAEIQASGKNISGVYPIYRVGEPDPFLVSCDMETDGGGWTVFQRRENGSVDFYLYWKDYKNGFGNVSSEHWLGNDDIHRLTIQKTYELRVDLGDFEGQTRYARYSSFHVGDEGSFYLMKAGDYSGDAGDSMSYHSCRQFTTRNRDLDEYVYNCAKAFKGGWWYGSCKSANLNGQYNNTSGQGITWGDWLGSFYSLKKTEMKIRPV